MFRKTWSYLNSFELSTPDPIFSKLPLVGSPLQIILISIAYLLFVFKLGPAFMRNRPAYKLRNALLIYNVIQVLLNLVLPVHAYLMIVNHRAYNLGCMSSLPNDHPVKYMEIRSFYLYYLIKFIDYLDTIFFVLRKSTRQITFLHVYHHIIMAVGMYIYTRYFGIGGHISSMAILNSIVHCFMYTYYFISALDPSMKSSIWWKKYITRLQITQFVLIILHNIYPLLFVPNCKSSKIMFYYMILQSSFILVLFGNFYKKAYTKNTKSTSAESGKKD